MAKKTTQSRISIGLGEEMEVEDPLSDVSIEDLAFGDYVNRLEEGEKYSFKVYRDLGSNRLEDLFKFDPGAMDYDTMIERLRDDLVSRGMASGVYRLRIRVNKVLKRNEQIMVAAPLRKDAPVSQASGMDVLLPHLTKFIGDMETRITDRLNMNRSMDVDPYKQMLVLATVMEKLRGTQAVSDPMAMLDRVLGIAPKLKALAGEVVEDEDSDDQKWIHLIDKFAPSINTIVLKAAGVDAGSNAGDGKIIHKQPDVLQEVSVVEDQSKGLSGFIASLRPQFQMLMLPASIDSDVDPYANMIMDQMDALAMAGKLPDGFDAVKVFSETGLVDLIVEIHPHAARFRGWLEKLRLSVLELLKDAGNGDGEVEGLGVGKSQ